jgi:ribosomal protein S18 acetylase RimI-like enzyme
MSEYRFKEIQLNALRKPHLDDIVGLYRQLSPGKEPRLRMKAKYLTNFQVFCAFRSDSPSGSRRAIVSIATLARVDTSEKSFGQVHDVVTDEAHRGKQFGREMSLAEEILRMMIDSARDQKFAYLELTSKPDREAANGLYQKVGFKLLAQAMDGNGTNLYRLYL